MFAAQLAGVRTGFSFPSSAFELSEHDSVAPGVSRLSTLPPSVPDVKGEVFLPSSSVSLPRV